MVSDFSAISCIPTRDMCRAVFELGLWDFVRNFEDNQRGFLFSKDPRIVQIDMHPLVDKHNHSGASFAYCARNVQFIAKNGVDAWIAKH